ncbi:MAG: FemAB family XrtA/PEP-CTERM system-associated protein, partial [Rhodospirillaceae bacterium]
VNDDDMARWMLDTHAEELLRSSGAAYLEYRCPAKINDDWEIRDDLYASFSGPLAPDEAENLKQIPRKQRAVVRKALASDLSFTIGTDTTALYDLYAVSVRNLGTPVFSKAYFPSLVREFSPDCDVLTVLAGGVPVASVLSFYFRDRVMPFYTGSLPAARRLGANDFMYWQLMRHAAAKGITTFDFGRSKIGTGPYEFKKNWGFLPERIEHLFLLRPGATRPDINPMNPKYRLMIALWKRLPIPIANLIGPPIVRNIA